MPVKGNNMLILNRKIDEEIKINSDITIKILSVSEGQVKIGIEAPPQVQILRGELVEKIIQNTVDAYEQSKIKVDDISSYRLNKIE